MEYNIYYGTIGKKLGCKYRFTSSFKNEKQAIQTAKEGAESLFYKNEGKYGIPTISDILNESKLTGIDVPMLYEEHIEDLCRWYAIPTELDIIPKRKIHW